MLNKIKILQRSNDIGSPLIEIVSGRTGCPGAASSLCGGARGALLVGLPSGARRTVLGYDRHASPSDRPTGAALERRDRGASGHPLMTAGAIRTAATLSLPAIDELRRGSGAPRHFAKRVSQLRRFVDARSADHGFAR